VLILVSPAVVQGASDVTRTIQHDIARRMKGAVNDTTERLPARQLSFVAADTGGRPRDLGDLWPVREQDMLQLITQRLQTLQTRKVGPDDG
jgi:hypothetical protein